MHQRVGRERKGGGGKLNCFLRLLPVYLHLVWREGGERTGERGYTFVYVRYARIGNKENVKSLFILLKQYVCTIETGGLFMLHSISPLSLMPILSHHPPHKRGFHRGRQTTASQATKFLLPAYGSGDSLAPLQATSVLALPSPPQSSIPTMPHTTTLTQSSTHSPAAAAYPLRRAQDRTLSDFVLPPDAPLTLPSHRLKVYGSPILLKPVQARSFYRRVSLRNKSLSFSGQQRLDTRFTSGWAFSLFHCTNHH